MKKITQEELIKEYYVNHPNQEIHHTVSVSWLIKEYQKRTGLPFADPDRGIRKLAQSGVLIKVSKGVYMYDPLLATEKDLEDFKEKQKEIIKKRDGYVCVVCGLGEKDGVEIHIDHIKPKELGGKATIENGQVLCAKHNFQKKTLKQTETGKKMFIRLYELAKSSGDKTLMKFCKDVLNIFEVHDMNGHIEWNE